MKKTTLLTFIAIVFFTHNSFGQNTVNKKYIFDYLTYPSTAINDAYSFNVTIHSGNLDFTEASLKGNKARKILEKHTKDISYFSFNNFKLTKERPNINVEIAFGEIKVISQVEKTYQIACTYKGAKLNSKENIKKNLKTCPALYYSLEYKLPYILKISNQTGTILFIKEYNQSGWSSFGYDKTGLTGFLKKEELDASYNKSGLTKIKREAGLEKIAESNKTIYKHLFFTQVTDKFKFGTGKSKSYDYLELTTTLEKVLDAFKNETNIKETLKEANQLWEKEIATLNIGDKKSRINRKIGTSIYGNLTLANMYLNNFEKAKSYNKEYLRLANMAGNLSIPERAKVIYHLVNQRADKYEINKELLINTQKTTPAPLLSNLMSSKKNTNHKFISAQNNSHYSLKK